MSELKTLKDLETDDVECYTGCFDQTKEPIVVVDELRQEVIKWIKQDFSVLPLIEPEQMIRKWMERFNLTEDDLQ